MSGLPVQWEAIQLAASGCDLTEYPRVLVSPESAEEDLKNALCILVALGRDTVVPPLEAAGIRARIESALRKLEAK